MRTFSRATVIPVGGVPAGAPDVAFGAKGGPPHPPGEETGSNNPSVPAVFVGTSPFPVACTAGDDSKDPLGELGVIVEGVLEHADYYIQGVATWQTDCGAAPAVAVQVDAEWGDNLSNAPLRQGSAIRTEIGFLADPSIHQMPGYEVVKPTLLDRESRLGTLVSRQIRLSELRVWSEGVTLDIRPADGTGVPVCVGEFSAEINATERVVYRFNWQKPVAGEYTITACVPGVELVSTGAGNLVDSDSDGVYETVTPAVNVGNKGGPGGPRCELLLGVV